ncbi:MAG: dual specificity protein phosphatase family protein [Gemmataceae bacterium]|nr:dual specificity protein phosphatase family protein [Gemmataceae bacterium]
MRAGLRYLLALSLLGMIVAGPFFYRWARHPHRRNFRVVRPGVLYRSGQLSLAGLKRICHDHGIRTVVTLRGAYEPGQPHPDRDEEEWCRKEGLFHYRLPPLPWNAPDGSIPAEENVKRFLEIMDDPRHYPVLIHCFKGTHRTGTMCCIFRMEYENWPVESALRELREVGYETLEEDRDVLDFLRRYRPRRQTSSLGAGTTGRR